MKIYLLKRTDKVDYDEYYSFVVVANTPIEAHRCACSVYYDKHEDEYEDDTSWPKEFEKVKVEIIGTARKEYTEPTIILGSFKAG